MDDKIQDSDIIKETKIIGNRVVMSIALFIILLLGLVQSCNMNNKNEYESREYQLSERYRTCMSQVSYNRVTAEECRQMLEVK